MKFNENLKYLRKKEELTQEELAEKLNVSRQAVTKWESGQALPDIANLKEIAVLFGVTTDELLGNDKIKNSTTIEKKLKDLPFLILLDILLVIFLVTELGIENPLVMLLMFSAVLVIFGFQIKKYFTHRKIIDMRQTKDGKKSRIKLVLKNAFSIGLIWLIIDFVIYKVREIQGLENMPIIEMILWVIGIVVFAIIYDYITLEAKVKKYNEEK